MPEGVDHPLVPPVVLDLGHRRETMSAHRSRVVQADRERRETP